MHGLYESGLREAAEWASPIDQHYYLSWLQSRCRCFGGDRWVDLFDSRSTPGSSSGSSACPIASNSMVSQRMHGRHVCACLQPAIVRQEPEHTIRSFLFSDCCFRTPSKQSALRKGTVALLCPELPLFNILKFYASLIEVIIVSLPLRDSSSIKHMLGCCFGFSVASQIRAVPPWLEALEEHQVLVRSTEHLGIEQTFSWPL